MTEIFFRRTVYRMSSYRRYLYRPTTVNAAAPPSALKPLANGGLKRALLVGINYRGTQYELAGCINDVVNMQSQIRTFFPQCADQRVIHDDTAMRPTRKNILDSIDWLVQGLRPGENILFHYSGHGGLIRDRNGDEVSGFDSCIYPVNGTALETITDDELRTVLAEKVPAGSKCFVVMDCCHSGSAVDLRCVWQPVSPTALTYTENRQYAKTAGTIVFLSGARDDQTAADTVDKQGRPCGALTMALLDVWKRHGAVFKPKHLLWDIRVFLRSNGYGQIPQLTTGDYLDIQAPFDLAGGL